MYKVYWTDKEDLVGSQEFTNLITALQRTHELRNEGNIFVTLISENPNSIGKPGVDSVENGKLPSGEDYTWRKRR